MSQNIKRLDFSIEDVKELAQGGTAVGTGLNSYEGFDREFCKEISLTTGVNFRPSPNKFESLGTNDALCAFHS